MHPLLIVLIGIAVVVGGVLLLRLHAFLALVLGALVVGLLTPANAVFRHSLEKAAISVEGVTDGGRQVVLRLNENNSRVGMIYLAFRETSEGAGLEEFARIRVTGFENRENEAGDEYQVAIARIDDQQPDQKLDENSLIVRVAAVASAVDFSKQTVGERLAAAFGNTCGKIGILIAMAAIIGKCLLDSGAADRIVRSALKVSGERGAPASFLASGFLLGIPVFFDTVFYLMMPLGKAMRMRTGRNYLLYVLTIVAGATMAHSLVPPTPGPLFVAEQLQVDLGLMIVAGCVVGVFSSTSGYLYAVFMNRRFEVPLRESPDFSLSDLEEISQRDESQLPPLWLSLTPILLPVVLIAGYTVIDTLELSLSDPVMRAAATLGNKNIALVIATVLAMGMLVWHKRTDLKELAGSVQGALASGGVIILITAAGGAFGGILQQTGIAGVIQQLPTGSPLLILVLAFLITTAVRTAQGSATVAMITAVGILSGIAASGDLGIHPVFLALAIGCGSKPIAWMNDSGFWVICKMSGMTETEGLKFITPMSILMGVTGLIVTLIGAIVLPL